jgi:hypothetical protein
MNKYASILIFALLFLIALKAQEKNSLDINGQVSAWTVAGLNDPVLLQTGVRFVPALTGRYSLKNQQVFDTEVSLNLNGHLTFDDFQLSDSSFKVKPYRIWLRYSEEKFEIRAGLQKINFGSARLFRPLMWFDAMDIRDPLQLTDGVYGVLAKYFFENNANVWLWGLIANDDPKGFESFGSSLYKPEFGGRIELPVGAGEIGLSYHHRTLREDLNRFNMILGKHEHLENRIGFNGKWDLGVGLWIEGSLSLVEPNYLSSFYFPLKTDMLNAGMDFTINIGNGLGGTLEYFRYHAGDKFLVDGSTAHVLGTMLNYPITLADNISAMIFCIPAKNNTLWLNYLSWSRSYDDWTLYGIAFWNPEVYNLPSLQTASRNLFAGKGLQLMVTYNF